MTTEKDDADELKDDIPGMFSNQQRCSQKSQFQSQQFLNSSHFLFLLHNNVS